MTDTKHDRYYKRRKGYETDHLIDGSTDHELLEHMGVPQRYIEDAVRLYDAGLPVEIEEWLDRMDYIFRPAKEKQAEEPRWAGVGLVFYGESGTRKTTTAAATLLKAIRRPIINSDPTGRNFTWHGYAMGRFVDWQEASELFRDAVDDEDADEDATSLRIAMRPTGPAVSRGDVLVLDDISRERRTEFNTGELQRVLRRRHDWCFPTILTTNHSPDEWTDVYGEVMASFLGRAFVPVEF